MISISKEDNAGTILYFISHGVSRTKYIIINLSVSIVGLAIQSAIWGILVLRYALNGVTHIDFFVETISEEVIHIMITFFLMNVLSVATGFFIGCLMIPPKKEAYHISTCFFFLMTFWAVFPNLINAVLTQINPNIHLIKIHTVDYILNLMQKINPLYICQPFISCKELSVSLTTTIILLSVLCIGIGSIIFINKVPD